MEDEIKKERKFSIRLPEDIKEEAELPWFEEALKNNIKPRDIVFYSLATGILKFTNHEQNTPKSESYYYNNPENLSIMLDIFVNKSDKEKPYPQVFKLVTKAKVESDKKKMQEIAKEAENKKK